MTPPPFRATCRLQLNAGFDLRAARDVVPYLARLGVSHVYASPVLTARRGSTHGYDVADPARVNPELGGEDALGELVEALHTHGMGLLLDIVPNHMGTGGDNPYWLDVLRHGRGSRWAKWFDIDWEAPHPQLRNRVMLPVLGDHLEKVLERNELTLARHGDDVWLRYFDDRFPLSPESSRDLPEDLAAFSAGPGGTQRMKKLLGAQHYRVAFWRRAAREINYRRFFDINDLIALRQEDPEVFAETHALVLDLVRRGWVDGLRIDHIDGLLDPLGYLERLRAEVNARRPPNGGAPLPIVVEKILSPGEHLRREWPVQGTTGYEFLNDLESIFMSAEGYDRIERAYRALLTVGDRSFDFHHIALSGKLRVLTGPLASDVLRLTRLLEDALANGQSMSELDRRDHVAAIVELLAALPVYRTYIDGRRAVPSETDRAILDVALQRAMHRREAPPTAISILGALLRQGAGAASGEQDRERRLRFILRFQQTSGPATAKGVEDTALYRYVPLASRNEVGGDPERDLRDAATVLHAANLRRATRWPRSLLCTNTHDTKRSADVRARLDVLSEIPQEWEARVRGWRQAHAAHRTKLGRRWIPDANTEYLIYQTLLGIWPLCEDGASLEEIRDRADEYLLKAAREAKTQTAWTEPDEQAEAAVRRFIAAILEPSSACVAQLGEFSRRVARPGLWNALARVAVHLTAPGVPDVYQGDELWNFALVDPDNRRPVSWQERVRLLDDLHDRWQDATATDPARLATLVEHVEDGRLKLHVTWRLLSLRRDRSTLFTSGEYDAMLAAGPASHHVFAFARRAAGEASITVVPRLPLTLVGDGGVPAGDAVWRDTVLPLSESLADRRWRCAIGGHEVEVARAGDLPVLRLGAVLRTMPVAVLVTQP